MAKIIKAAFKANICDAYGFFVKQFCRVYQAIFINELREGFAGDFFKISTKGGYGHAYQLRDFFKCDLSLKFFFYKVKDDIDAIVVL